MADSCGVSILLKAWRERWTPLQWLVEIKKKVKKDGHKGLAECLVQQATFGTTPSMLILSYLKHGIMAEVVPCSEAIEAIQKFQNIEKHRCLTALLDLLLSFIPNLSCHDDGEDALDLTTSMVKLIYWLLIVAINLLKLCREAARSSDEASLHYHLGNTKRCQKAFSQLMSSPTYRSLIMVGKMEDPGIATELDCQFQAHMKELFVVTQSEGMVHEVQIHFKDLMINYNRLHSLTPLNGSGDHQPGVVPNIAVQNLVQIQNLVFPTDSPEKLAGLLDAVMRMQNITRLQLFLEVMRSTLVGMLESQPKSMEEAIWTGFFFFKLPRVLNEMENKYQSQGNQTTNMEHSIIQATLQQLRVFTPLLDDVDIKYKCNCYKEFIEQYCKYVPQQVAERLGNLSSARKSPSELESVTLGQIYQPFLLLLDAETKVIPVLEKLEDEQTVKDDKFLNQLSSLFNVAHSKWRLVAIASISKMPSLVAELIRLAEQTKHPSEGDEDNMLNSCVLRGDLFNAAFILLCHIAQVFGREVILDAARSRDLDRAFMTQWIASHIPESDHSRTFYSNPQYPPNPATVNLLLNQFYTRGPFMTSDARWDDVCVNVPIAMHEMLKSWQYESHTCSSDTIQKLCESIKYEVPAWAICVCCWCCGYSHELRMEQRAYYTGERSETGLVQSGLLQFLLTPINAKGMPQTFTDRCSMMVEVMKQMSVNIERKDYIPSSNPAPINEPITKNMCQLLNDVIKQKNISSKILLQFKQLLILGGAEWFCSTIIKELLKFSRQEDISNAADIASCLMLLDTKLLVPVLIRRAIPLYLHHSNANYVLQDPKGWGLARLAAHAVNFGLLCEQSHDDEQQQQRQGAKQGNSSTEKQQNLRYFTSQSHIQKALVWLCEELVSVVDDNKVGPVASVLKNFLQQAAQCNSPTSGSVLACLPTELTGNLLELTPIVCCTPDVILGICSLKNSDGRKLCARVLCRSKQTD